MSRTVQEEKITINDIAKVSGVSKSTVSLVLNNSPLVRPATAEKVREVAARLGYVYNRSAANLRQGSSNVIGMVVNDLSNSFFVELLIGAERKLLQSNYITLLAHTAEDQDVQRRVIASMREQKAAGIIICPTFETPRELVDQLRAWGMPFVTVMRALGDQDVDFVGCDNFLGIELATQHLINLGHRDIAFIGRNSTYSVSLERLRGYSSCLSRNGLVVNPSWIIDTSISLAGGREGMSRLLDLAQQPTAVICYNDLIATGALSELGHRGLQPGVDMAVIGSDGVTTSAYCNPPLTTIALEPSRLGEIASEVLLERLRSPETPPLRHLVKPNLVVRDTCGANIHNRRTPSRLR